MPLSRKSSKVAIECDLEVLDIHDSHRYHTNDYISVSTSNKINNSNGNHSNVQAFDSEEDEHENNEHELLNIKSSTTRAIHPSPPTNVSLISESHLYNNSNSNNNSITRAEVPPEEDPILPVRLSLNNRTNSNSNYPYTHLNNNNNNTSTTDLVSTPSCQDLTVSSTYYNNTNTGVHQTHNYSSNPAKIDWYGNSALHQIFARLPVDYHQLSDLLRTQPHLARHQNQFGRTPLHYALDRSRVSKTAIKLLVQTYPEGVAVADHNGHTPYDLAVRWQHSKNILHLLLSACPDLDKDALLRLKYGPLGSLAVWASGLGTNNNNTNSNNNSDDNSNISNDDDDDNHYENEEDGELYNSSNNTQKGLVLSRSAIEEGGDGEEEHEGTIRNANLNVNKSKNNIVNSSTPTRSPTNNDRSSCKYEEEDEEELECIPRLKLPPNKSYTSHKHSNSKTNATTVSTCKGDEANVADQVHAFTADE